MGGVEAGGDAGQVADRHHLVERELRLVGDLLVGGLGRSSFAVSSLVIRFTVRSRWATCAGIRTGRPVLSRPRWIDCLIHRTAYVENL